MQARMGLRRPLGAPVIALDVLLCVTRRRACHCRVGHGGAGHGHFPWLRFTPTLNRTRHFYTLLSPVVSCSFFMIHSHGLRTAVDRGVSVCWSLCRVGLTRRQRNFWLRNHEIPVHSMPETLDIFCPGVAIINAIGVFPDIAGQQRSRVAGVDDVERAIVIFQCLFGDMGLWDSRASLPRPIRQ